MRYAEQHCACTRQGDKYVFTGPCIVTGEAYSVAVPEEELFAYRQGVLIQTAMPSVSREDRHFLMDGYSPQGWLEMFGTPS